MRSFWSVFAVAIVVASAMGCAMCQNSYDDTYAAYGGSQPRADMTYGRVGSRFAAAEGMATTAPTPDELWSSPDDLMPTLASP